jgi:hypothetical protein
LFIETVAPNVYEIKILIDFGSGLYTTINSFLIVNGEIIDMLWDWETYKFNENYNDKVYSYRK